MSGLVIIRSFDSVVEANIVKGKLISEGIECFLQDENVVGLNPLLSNATGGVKLVVSTEDAFKANEVLRKNDEEYGKVVKCKFCGSSEVHYVSKSGNVFNWLWGVIGLAFNALPLYIKKTYRCEQCNATYKLEDFDS